MSLKNSVTAQEVVDLLNEVYKLDPDCAERLRSNHVECNKVLADHPTIQVLGKKDKFRVGLIGFLNGLFGIKENGFGCIAAIYGDDGKLQKFIYDKNLGEEIFT